MERGDKRQGKGKGSSFLVRKAVMAASLLFHPEALLRDKIKTEV